MIKVLVCESVSSSRKYNFFLKEEEWKKFNEEPNPEYRIYNLNKIIPLAKTTNDILNDLIIINILELPSN